MTAQPEVCAEFRKVRIGVCPDLDNLPDPDVLAEEIIVNLESGLESFRTIMETVDSGDVGAAKSV